ncbi:unnamed protein product, partial [Amoebophrya sp. A25]
PAEGASSAAAAHKSNTKLATVIEADSASSSAGEEQAVVVASKKSGQMPPIAESATGSHAPSSRANTKDRDPFLTDGHCRSFVRMFQEAETRQFFVPKLVLQNIPQNLSRSDMISIMKFFNLCRIERLERSGAGSVPGIGGGAPNNAMSGPGGPGRGQHNCASSMDDIGQGGYNSPGPVRVLLTWEDVYCEEAQEEEEEPGNGKEPWKFALRPEQMGQGRILSLVTSWQRGSTNGLIQRCSCPKHKELDDFFKVEPMPGDLRESLEEITRFDNTKCSEEESTRTGVVEEHQVVVEEKNVKEASGENKTGGGNAGENINKSTDPEVVEEKENLEKDPATTSSQTNAYKRPLTASEKAAQRAKKQERLRANARRLADYTKRQISKIVARESLELRLLADLLWKFTVASQANGGRNQ